MNHPVAALLLSLFLLGTPADASLWGAKIKVCPDGTTVTSPAPCPPQPGVSKQ
ncbi:hypothetical protein [Deinococcus apachensis]|uniref:hypothetical protein n=1 Tax=Deinococcus apachensis TaxID=309886 RepID=UPI0003702A53|nr:hypothetical protein [Deinococcus apachensis]